MRSCRGRVDPANPLVASAISDAIADDILRTLVPLAAVSICQASGPWVGLLSALPFIWFILGATRIGRFTDDDPRRAAQVGVLVRIAATATLAALLWAAHVPLLSLVLVVILLGLGDAVFTTAHSVMIPQTVGVEHTARVYQLIETIGSLARIGSPLLVAWMLSHHGFTTVAFASVIAYLATFACVALLPRAGRPQGMDRPDQPASPASENRWNVAQVLRCHGLSHCTISSALLNVSAMISGTALVFYALDVLRIPAARVPWFGFAGAVGGLLGASAVRLFARATTGTAKLVAASGCAVASSVVPLTALLPKGQLGVALAGEALTALFMTSASIIGSDVPARLVPSPQLGAASASIRSLTIGVMPVAALAGGLLVAATGATTTLAIGAFTALVAALVFIPVRGWHPPTAPSSS